MKLFDRLREVHQEALGKAPEGLEISHSIALRILNEKKFWLDLTLMECDTICIVLLADSFRDASQIANLFNKH
jgi:hypothetical protein